MKELKIIIEVLKGKIKNFKILQEKHTMYIKNQVSLNKQKPGGEISDEEKTMI